MDNSRLMTMIVVLIAMAAALAIFSLLRNRGRSSAVAGGAAIGTGLLIVVGYVTVSIILILS